MLSVDWASFDKRVSVAELQAAFDVLEELAGIPWQHYENHFQTGSVCFHLQQDRSSQQWVVGAERNYSVWISLNSYSWYHREFEPTSPPIQVLQHWRLGCPAFQAFPSHHGWAIAPAYWDYACSGLRERAPGKLPGRQDWSDLSRHWSSVPLFTRWPWGLSFDAATRF